MTVQINKDSRDIAMKLVIKSADSSKTPKVQAIQLNMLHELLLLMVKRNYLLMKYQHVLRKFKEKYFMEQTKYKLLHLKL